jgi:hypothetical protein
VSSHGDAEEPFDVFYDATLLAGAWVDSTHVHRGHRELTLDFVRSVPLPAERVLVARVTMAPSVAMDLRDQLDQAWRSYSEWSMPEGGT